jgi:hypothetical protein
MHALKGNVALGLVLALATGCGPSTKMLATWSAPDVERERVSKVLVLGVARDPTIRRSYEDEFVRTLERHDYEAVASYEWIAEVIPELDKQVLRERIEQNGVTHVLTTRLVDQKTVETYTPPTYATVGYAPYYPGWYGSYYSYWSVGYTTMTSPGYVTASQVVSLETNLYRASDEKLLWTGLTETWVSDYPLQENISSVIQKVVFSLRQKKIL